ncbi:hypothetical protein RB195_017938 [Necator americanus]|uniref:Secreted protein n=1 Tax=Necator americanus TaxID=51031 RepID=A0ABR1CB30_NECAM
MFETTFFLLGLHATVVGRRNRFVRSLLIFEYDVRGSLKQWTPCTAEFNNLVPCSRQLNSHQPSNNFALCLCPRTS